MSAARLNARLRALEEPTAPPSRPRVLFILPDDGSGNASTGGSPAPGVEFHVYNETGCRFPGCVELHDGYTPECPDLAEAD